MLERKGFLKPALASILCVCAVQSTAAADGVPGALLEWDAPLVCPEVSHVVEHLTRVLGRTPEDLRALGRVRAVVSARPDGFQLTLELFDGQLRRSRIISSDRCDPLAEAAAIAIALALDEAAAPASERPRSEPDPAAPAASADADSGQRARVDAGAESAALHPVKNGSALGFDTELAGVLDANSLPGAAPGLSLGARLRLADTFVGVYGTYLPAIEESVGPDRFVNFGLWLGGARVCQRVFETLATGSLCLGFEVGNLHASGRGLVNAQEADDLWLGPNAAAELGTRLWDPIGLQLRVEALRPLMRRRYVVNEADGVYRPPGASFRLYLGAIWHLN